MNSRLFWIQSILQERFGYDFELIMVEEKLNLFLVGSQLKVSFDQLNGAFFGSGLDLPCLTWDAFAEGWQSALGRPLPAPGLARLSSPLIEQTESGYCIHYDLLGLTCWMLSRQEEVGRSDLDEYGRFPATSSHAFKHGYLERPVVDEWLHIFGQVIQKTWPALQLKAQQFSMKVSHDVDEPGRYAFRSTARLARAMAGDVLKRGDWKSALLAPWVRLHSNTALHPADPANTFDWIMDMSERHGLKSAFYFICGRTAPSFDADYEPEHPAIRELMHRIHARGHEIGLHPSYGSYQTPAIIQAEADRLRRIASEEGIEQPEWGGRMHYLRWEHPTTLLAWEQAGMSYDSTMNYAERVGFRCGTCFEYPAFDPVAGKALKLRIRPLIAMECTVIAPPFKGLSTGEVALNKFLALKAACKAVGGCFTLLWHNSNFDSLANRAMYEAVIQG
jgi:hypothetical protein